MSAFLLSVRLLLAAVFAIAGLAKLRDLDGSRQAIEDFGLPRALAVPFGTVLPLAELAVAVALVVRTSAWWGALGALVLLGLFIVGIAQAMARGREPDCHCFGQLHSSPAGWSTLGRNALLAAVAGFVVIHGSSDTGTSALAWINSLSAAELVGLAAGVVLVAAIAFQSWFSLQLLRQNGRMLARLDAVEARLGGELPDAAPPDPSAPGLPIGAPAPEFTISGVHGETSTLASLRAGGRSVLLLFADPGCGPCNAMMPEIAGWQRAHSDQLAIAMLSRGSLEDNRAKVDEHGLVNVLLQRDREVAESYLAAATPTGVLVDEDGRIASHLHPGVDAIRQLLGRATQSPVEVVHVPAQHAGTAAEQSTPGAQSAPAPAQPAVPAIGEPAPDAELVNAAGDPLALSGLRGDDLVLIFWSLGCGFCRQMLGDLRSWERDAPASAPRVVVVSTSTLDENVGMALESLVLTDTEGVAMRAYGAGGTPMAIGVDAAGRISSELVAGAPAVLALASKSALTDGAA